MFCDCWDGILPTDGVGAKSIPNEIMFSVRFDIFPKGRMLNWCFFAKVMNFYKPKITRNYQWVLKLFQMNCTHARLVIHKLSNGKRRTIIGYSDEDPCFGQNLMIEARQRSNQFVSNCFAYEPKMCIQCNALIQGAELEHGMQTFHNSTVSILYSEYKGRNISENEIRSYNYWYHSVHLNLLHIVCGKQQQ